MLTVCLSLYILDHVSRTEYTRAEPTPPDVRGSGLDDRTDAWRVARGNGRNMGHLRAEQRRSARRSVSPTSGTCACATPRRSRCSRDALQIRSGTSHATGSNRASFSHGWRQPGRYIWWVMFFVYVPIYVVEAGYSKVVAGALISDRDRLPALPAPLRALSCGVFGIRAVLRVGFTVSGVLTATAALLAGWPVLCHLRDTWPRRWP